MKAAERGSARLTPWLWGINGATSVCASVLAVIVSLTGGIGAAFWTGFAAYGIAAGAFLWMTVKVHDRSRRGGQPARRPRARMATLAPRLDAIFCAPYNVMKFRSISLFCEASCRSRETRGTAPIAA
jgi:hypothetical protein